MTDALGPEPPMRDGQPISWPQYGQYWKRRAEAAEREMDEMRQSAIVLTDKELTAAVVQAVMSDKQSERDDAVLKLQRHILSIEAERDAREKEAEEAQKRVTLLESDHASLCDAVAGALRNVNEPDDGITLRCDLRDFVWTLSYKVVSTRQKRDAALRKVEELNQDVARLKRGLDFYARGCHFDKGEPDDWDTVSGEPQNFWCHGEDGSTVEDGSIAKLFLEGYDFDPDPDAEGMIPPRVAAALGEKP